MNREEAERLGGRGALKKRARERARLERLKKSRAYTSTSIDYFVGFLSSCVSDRHRHDPFRRDWLDTAEHYTNYAIRSLPPEVRRKAGL